ncbi:MAG: NADPH-dependent reductase [Rhodospirillales bacterium]|nr:NADPH-dependent reductase [Rhodospirillales bacterium]
MKSYKLLGIGGSVRRDSYSVAVLRAIGESVPDGVSFEIFPLDDVPIYNQDLDTAIPPPAVVALRAAIDDADGVVISSPEYNHSISGVLKNALDWASRPYGAATLTGKPVLTLTSSPAFTGGVRAQAHLNEVLTAIAARLVLRPQIVIASVHEKIRHGRLVDDATVAFLKSGVLDLLRDSEVLRTTGPFKESRS